jgi:hypothetical protein
MTDQGAPIVAHLASAKEHLAGIKAARVWHQDLAAKHLLDTQRPVKDDPIPDHRPEPT